MALNEIAKPEKIVRDEIVKIGPCALYNLGALKIDLGIFTIMINISRSTICQDLCQRNMACLRENVLNSKCNRGYIFCIFYLHELCSS